MLYWPNCNRNGDKADGINGIHRCALFQISLFLPFLTLLFHEPCYDPLSVLTSNDTAFVQFESIRATSETGGIMT